MKATKSTFSAAFLVLTLTALTASQTLLLAARSATEWSVQVEKIDPGDVSIEPAFQVAIYENLVDELGKSKQFKKVMRSGDRTANDVSQLLVLKTTVEAYSPGSETRRAVTTVSGATKIKVRSQLSTQNGQILREVSVAGDVRFFGGNLRATHNLAHNVANAIKPSTLPSPTSPAGEQ
jgi:hypothetical protein